MPTRNPELHARRAGSDGRRSIAIAAVRYFLVKFTRGKVIAFDIDEALSFEGETGPYLQYAVVRANNILAKLAERDGIAEDAIVGRLPALAPRRDRHAARRPTSSGASCSRPRGSTRSSTRRFDRSSCRCVAKYAFGLAQAFNAFYHRQQILREEREDARLWRAAGVVYVRRQLTRALDLMGCAVPSRM